MTDVSVRIKVRHYECDMLGHLNHAVYHQYGEVARLEWFESHGRTKGLAFPKVSPVLLETHVRFRREIRPAEEVDVTCAATFGEGKTFTMSSEIRKLDGTVAATVECVMGVMDMVARKLVDDPRGALRDAGLEV